VEGKDGGSRFGWAGRCKFINNILQISANIVTVLERCGSKEVQNRRVIPGRFLEDPEGASGAF
jgi:hypothetical protein